jgi:hypothetical protein
MDEEGGKKKQLLPLTRLEVGSKILEHTVTEQKGKAGFAEIKKLAIYKGEKKPPTPPILAPITTSTPTKATGKHHHTGGEVNRLASSHASLNSLSLSLSNASAASSTNNLSQLLSSPIRTIAVSDLPELRLTRPKKPPML